MERVKDIFINIASFLIPGRASNWRVILLCFTGATTFWLFNALNKDYTTTINYPILIDYDNGEFIAITPPPTEIQLNLSGVGWNLLRRTARLNVTPVLISVQNPAEQKALSGASLRGELSDQLPDFRLNFILTDSLRLNFQRKKSRKIALAVDSIKIDLRENHYIISEIKVDFDSATFTGPEQLVNALPDTFVIRLPAESLSQNYAGLINLQPNERPDLFKVDPMQIEVSFTVAEFIRAERSIPVHQVNFPADGRFILGSDQYLISFMVQDGTENQVSSDQFEIVADFSRMVRADSTIQPLIKKHPHGIYDIRMESGRVKVIYE